VFDDKNCERKQQYEENTDFMTKNFYSKYLNDFLFDPSFNFTNTTKNPHFLIGEEVMCLNSKENYQIHWPVWNGYLNVKSGQSAITCIEMIEKILTRCLEQRLKIPKENF